MKDIHGKHIRTAAEVRANNKAWDIINSVKKPAHALRRRLGKPTRPSKEQRQHRHKIQHRIHLSRLAQSRRIEKSIARATRHATGQHPAYRS